MPATDRSPSTARPPLWRSWRTPLWVAAILLVTLAIYGPALHGQLLWDDTGHVTRPDLRSFSGLGRIWFEVGATQQYYPVLHSAFWLEHRLWGDAVFGYHLLNVLLHAASACLFALVLQRIWHCGGRKPTVGNPPETDQLPAQVVLVSWIAALLFAVHPIGVESAAWISEQKNTLSTALYLGSALAYLRFSEARSAAGPRYGARALLYATATGLFLLALFTKTVTATLPAALLVVLIWRRGRLAWRENALPLVPWFVIGAASGLFTAHFEQQLIGAQGADFALTAIERCLLAGRVFWFYLATFFWPADLVFIYPRWNISASDPLLWLSLMAALALLAGVAVVALRSQSTLRSPARALLVSLLLFGGSLFPVLGFFNVFPFLYSYVADHFQYLAMLPLCAVAASVLTGAFGRGRPPGGPAFDRATPTAGRPEVGPYLNAPLVAFVAVILVALGALSWRQAHMYRDPFALYEMTLARNPACWMAHNNLAIELAASGRIADAVPHLETALKLKPDFAPAENNLGDDLVRLGRAPEAIPHFERALELHADYPVAHRNLGMALAMTNRVDQAVAHFARAAQLNPNDAEAELDWAVALDQSGDFRSAVVHFDRALALAPQSADTQLAYADAFAAKREYDEAIKHYEAALTLSPNSPDAHRGLATALRRVGRANEALGHEEAARRLSESASR